MKLLTKHKNYGLCWFYYKHGQKTVTLLQPCFMLRKYPVELAMKHIIKRKVYKKGKRAWKN